MGLVLSKNVTTLDKQEPSTINTNLHSQSQSHWLLPGMLLVATITGCHTTTIMAQPYDCQSGAMHTWRLCDSSLTTAARLLMYGHHAL